MNQVRGQGQVLAAAPCSHSRTAMRCWGQLTQFQRPQRLIPPRRHLLDPRATSTAERVLRELNALHGALQR